jgi:murein DD-endopeptidase MepM/ murein hydrolase activator NlpD
VPESPLVPDGSTPGTPLPVPSEQPLTRRERREREAAAARAAANEGVTDPVAEVAAQPEAVREPQATIDREPVASTRRERRAGETSGRRARDAADGGEASGRRARGAVAPRTPAASSTVPVAASTTPRRGGRRALRAVVAMGFAATLALATSVPALSLLTPSDVQAMALATKTGSSETAKLSTQSVDVDGDVIASPTVEREGYLHQSIEEYARAAGIRAEATFTNNPSGTIQWPFAVGVHIGDEFGPRSCPGCSSDHGGQDFNPGLGAEIQAIADGVVSNSTDSGGSLGVVMMIDHVIDGATVTSVYAHMQYDSRRFQVGDTVQVGDVIGTTGSTGMSTGPHLHFEIRLGGINGTKVNPLDWLYANTN